jgi:hypothetical protein
MGSEVTAKCRCGVDANMMIGGGMVNFMTTCYFPCLCDRCHAIVQVNLLAKRKRCPQCKSTKVIPYDDPTLSECTGKRTVVSWNMEEQLGRDLKLTNGKYQCPECGKMTLRFTECSQWD